MKILERESMKLHTTFRTGGEADTFIEVSSVDDVKAAVATYNNLLVIGNGSNLLVSDKGIHQPVLHLLNEFNKIELLDDGEIYAEAGALLSRVAAFARDNSLAGLEFASGIPGSVGGAVVMNAGAYGGEMKQVITFVDVFMNGEVKTIPASEMDFDYRHSRAMDEDMVILAMRVKLIPGNPDEITALMKDFNQRRRDKQPLEFPSAGSTFKRPTGYFAGKLIQDAGLAGFQIGGARVSEKHCGFVINAGNATSKDVYDVIKHVQKTVLEKLGVVLETEVRLIGDFE
ncbi:MAG: UDP-N-acetylmuramate dehydrogenase [Lachnospiraceae bacterium]|nr:UDP-N-acetylmuramate dehydrogenase [Lachnospiraceae bacterium]